MGMATWMDPLRTTSFPQNWTIYYWAYWMVWCVATPFFIGKISKGRTIKETVLGGYAWGLLGTFLRSLFWEIMDWHTDEKRCTNIEMIANTGDYAEAILRIFQTLPLPRIALLLLAVTMIAFYATTFDALTMVISVYSYKKIRADAEPDKRIKIILGSCIYTVSHSADFQ